MDLIKAQRILGVSGSLALDGVEAAVISTDGVDVFDVGAAVNVPYDDDLLEKLRRLQGKRREEIADDVYFEADEALTDFYASVIQDFIADYDEKIDVIAFAGHILYLNPQEHYISSIGNAAKLAEKTGIKVVSRFSQADMLAGGCGAPLTAVYHAFLGANLEKPVCFLDIGGISSLTWLGDNGEMLAFDIGPGLAPVNDWVLKHGGMQMDYNGSLAVTGQVDTRILSTLMKHKFLALYPPKAADRDTFKEKCEHLEGLSLSDGAATSTAFIAEAVAYSLAIYVPEMPKKMVVCGIGAQNPTLLRFLRQRLQGMDVINSAEEGWKPEAVEAQAYAFIAARRLYNLPISYPLTTGVPEPMVCGEIF